MKKCVDTTSFIEKSTSVHGGRYGYSKSVFKSSSVKVEVICKVHGSFFVTPNNHISKGSGCPKCATIEKANRRRMTSNEFIRRASKKHGSKYDYSLVNYTNAEVKVDIICPTHGKFSQRPSGHLIGKGCNKCQKNNKKDTAEFILHSRKIHGDKYDYSAVNYIGGRSLVKIACPKHGSFKQLPENHLQGCGCPKCGKTANVSRPECEFLDHLKVIRRQVKIRGVGPVDGLKGKTVYEFLGDFWHGNPNKYDLDEIHPITKSSFREIYEKTMSRLTKLKMLGYKVCYIWENDWNVWHKNNIGDCPIQVL